MHSEDLEKLFFKRLLQLRNEKGVSARDMSLSLGQNENYINNIENRKNFPSLKGLFYICEYLDVHPKDFFNDEIESPELTAKFLKQIENLNKNEIEHLMLIVNDLLERAARKTDIKD